MKVYTRTGDSGQTALIGGERVKKNHPCIEAYGTVDELMAHTALLMDMTDDANDKYFLSWILARLMDISSILATQGDTRKKIPEITTAHCLQIENAIDAIESELTPLNSFLLPGGHISISQCHVCRTVCRRAERNIISMIDAGYDTSANLTSFINRLSDYFFVFSRKITKKLNISAKKWIPFED